jgi:hypothetical protein
LELVLTVSWQFFKTPFETDISTLTYGLVMVLCQLSFNLGLYQDWEESETFIVWNTQYTSHWWFVCWELPRRLRFLIKNSIDSTKTRPGALDLSRKDLEESLNILTVQKFSTFLKKAIITVETFLTVWKRTAWQVSRKLMQLSLNFWHGLDRET